VEINGGKILNEYDTELYIYQWITKKSINTRLKSIAVKQML